MGLSLHNFFLRSLIMIKVLILSLLFTGSLARFARMNNDDPNDGKDAEASKDMTTNLQDNVVLINMKMFWFVGDNPNSKNLTTILDSRELTENPSIPKETMDFLWNYMYGHNMTDDDFNHVDGNADGEISGEEAALAAKEYMDSKLKK